MTEESAAQLRAEMKAGAQRILADPKAKEEIKAAARRTLDQIAKMEPATETKS